MKKSISKAVLIITMLIAVMFWAAPAGAEGSSYQVSFPVTVSTPGDSLSEDIKITLVIEGQPHAPLPNPCEITADINGTYEFNPIEFTEPGNYKYIVKQIAIDNSHFIPDKNEYEIDVTVVRNESGNLEGGFVLSYKAGSGKPHSISFHNGLKYSGANVADQTSSDNGANNSASQSNNDTSQNEKAPHTGEPLSPAFGGLIFSCVLFLFFLIVRKKRLHTEALHKEEASTDEKI